MTSMVRYADKKGEVRVTSEGLFGSTFKEDVFFVSLLVVILASAMASGYFIDRHNKKQSKQVQTESVEKQDYKKLNLIKQLEMNSARQDFMNQR